MMKQTAEEKREDIFLHRPGFGKRDCQTATKQKNSRKTSQLDMESMVLSGSQLSDLRVMLLIVIPIAMILTAIFGGYTAYRMNMLNDIRMHYRAFCIIPYGPLGNTTEMYIYTDKDFSNLFNDKNIENFNVKVDHTVFREEIEMDISDDEGYASIEVPSFNRIRRARFLHDFKANQSAIIDPISNRCFVMPLDRETVMSPKNFVNLITKAGSSFLNTSVNRIQRTVIVLTPYLPDLLTISKFIGDECDDMIIYKTEVYAAGDFRKKIELKSPPATYAEYLGISIIEFNVVNMDYIEEYEHLLWH